MIIKWNSIKDMHAYMSWMLSFWPCRCIHRIWHSYVYFDKNLPLITYVMEYSLVIWWIFISGINSIISIIKIWKACKNSHTTCLIIKMNARISHLLYLVQRRSKHHWSCVCLTLIIIQVYDISSCTVWYERMGLCKQGIENKLIMAYLM